MIAPSPASPRPNRRRLCAFSCLTYLVLGASQASALPRVQVDPSPEFLLVQAAKPGERPDSEQQAQENRQAPFADLNEVLEAIRAELEELFSATAIVAERRKEAEALKQESERLAAELEQASSRRTELEDWSKRAEARIAELTNVVDAGVQKAARLDKELAEARRRNSDLEEGVARADTARKAAEANAEKTRTEMEAKLEAATNAAEQSRAELVGLREELARTGKELATANSARQQVAARASEMEQAVERSGAEAERLKSELAEVKEQFDQAATAAVDAERARQAASSEADLLRGEAGRAREQLTAAQSEIERFKTANTELEKQIASLHAHSKSATETARQTLIVMEEKIEELNAALVGAGRVETTPTESPPANQRADISTQEPTTAPAQVDAPGLERFDANVRSLNSRALEVAGADLFSGIKSVGDGVVHVSTTPAWKSIPPAGQRSYLNSLFQLWTGAQEGSGPAVVRIVDSSGRVLLEQSGTAKDGTRD